MEEPKISKTCSIKQSYPTDPTALQLQCHEQLQKLNQQLRCSIAEQRNNQLQKSIPSITKLSDEIIRIKQNLSCQVSLKDSKIQRQAMLIEKQGILKNIQEHSKKIEVLKKQLTGLNITYDEIVREYEQCQEQINNTAQFADKNSLHHSRCTTLQSNQTILPSIFTKSTKPSSNVIAKQIENDSKWGRIDKLFMKIDNYPTDSLSRALVDLAKSQNGAIKSVFKNYKTNEKMSEFIKKPQIKREIAKLLKIIDN